MSVIRLSGFLGENRAIHPTMLPDAIGVSSLNQKPGYGDLRPWKSPSATGSLATAGSKTIYRMNRSVASDTNYWLSWGTNVHTVVGPNAATSDERTFYTGAGTPKWTDLTKAIAGAAYPNAYRELGVPSPVSAITAAAVPQVVSGTRTSETVFYVYTYVTDVGEESAPSPVSTIVSIQNGDHVSITNMVPPPYGAYGVNRIRVYRTQSGSSSTQFYYLTEVLSMFTTASDTGQTIGEVLPTTTWLAPPADLRHLTAMWNGMMAGISGPSVRVCEAFVPYAWPIAYEILPLDTTPVALVTFGQNLVILTNGRPILVTGSSPDSLDEQPIEYTHACVAEMSAVSIGTGVVYASPDGLAFVGTGGARLLTERVMTRVEWQAINPSSMRGAYFEGRYYATYVVASVTKMLMVDMANQDGVYFMDFGVDAVYVDLMQDAMYVLAGTSIQKWDTGTTLTTTFKSKLFTQPKPIQGYACAQVRADTYPVAFSLYADNVLVYTQSVLGNDPFRLPGGYYAREFQISVGGAYPIQSVAVAHSMQELAQV